MHQDLIERYIYAVIKTLPTRMREDVERELHSLISDMLEERCQDMPSTEHDVLVVLTELGRPAELAAKYRPERASYLIGPGYYAAYKFLLGLVLGADFSSVAWQPWSNHPGFCHFRAQGRTHEPRRTGHCAPAAGA